MQAFTLPIDDLRVHRLLALKLRRVAVDSGLPGATIDPTHRKR